MWSREAKRMDILVEYFSKGLIYLTECINPLLLLLSCVIEKRTLHCPCRNWSPPVPILVFPKCRMHIIRILALVRAWRCGRETLFCYAVGLCCPCCPQSMGRVTSFQVTGFSSLKQWRWAACVAASSSACTSSRLGLRLAVIILSSSHWVCGWNTGTVYHAHVPCAPPCCPGSWKLMAPQSM